MSAPASYGFSNPGTAFLRSRSAAAALAASAVFSSANSSASPSPSPLNSCGSAGRGSERWRARRGWGSADAPRRLGDHNESTRTRSPHAPPTYHHRDEEVTEVHLVRLQVAPDVEEAVHEGRELRPAGAEWPRREETTRRGKGEWKHHGDGEGGGGLHGTPHISRRALRERRRPTPVPRLRTHLRTPETTQPDTNPPLSPTPPTRTPSGSQTTP